MTDESCVVDRNPEQNDDLDLYDGNGFKITVEELAAAKAILVDGIPTRFFVRVSAEGELFDPREWKVTERDHVGDPKFKMQEVDAPNFETYVKFLKTKNALFYHPVRRAVGYNYG